MDLSDIRLLFQLPLQDNTFLNDIIRTQLDLENIPSNQPPRLRKDPLVIPSTINTDWTKKATGVSFLEPVHYEDSPQQQSSEAHNSTTACSKQQIRKQKGNITVSDLKLMSKKIKLQDAGENASSEEEVKVSDTRDIHCAIEDIKTLTGSFGINSNSVAYSESMNKSKGKCDDVSSKPPQDRLLPRQPDDGEGQVQRSQSRQKVPDNVFNEEREDEIFFSKGHKDCAAKLSLDDADLDHVVNSLVTAQEIFCSKTPDPGTREWTEFRQSQAVFRANVGSTCVPGSRSPEKEETIHITRRFIKIFQKIIEEVVKFAKRIPGFKDQHIEDQISLLRESRQLMQFPNTLRSINEEQRIVTPVQGEHLCFEYFVALHSEEIISYTVQLSHTRILNTMTTEEDALIKAILVTNPDFCKDLRNREAIERIHITMIACLFHVIKKTSSDAARRQKEIERFLRACRQFSDNFRGNVKEKLQRLQVTSDENAVIDTL